MLGSLGRKLRALGFDTKYYKDGEDSALLRLAASEKRVVLTSDRQLASRASALGIAVFLLSGSNDGARVAEISRAAARQGIDLTRGPPLCSLCGGPLAEISKGEAAGLVPAAVERRHRRFQRCGSCGQVYWKGSHWKKLRLLARRLRAK